MDYRTEHDSLGEVSVPAEAYWGAQTGRAVANFPISGSLIGHHAPLTETRLDEVLGPEILAG
jgi:aspartate ammonia-lyase